MNHIRPRKILLVLALLTLLIGLPAWKVYRDARQQHLNDALIAAVRQADLDRVETLLAQGADPSARETPGGTLSPWRRLRQMLTGILAHPAVQQTRESAFHIAASYLPSDCPDGSNPRRARYEPIVWTLVEHGADVRTDTREDADILCDAAGFGSDSYLKLLLEHGADPNGGRTRGSPDDISPLRWAVGSGEPEKLRLLLAHGADVNARDADGGTALSIALSTPFSDHSEKVMIALLKQAGAK